LNRFKISWRISHIGQNKCQLFVSITIVNQQLKGHKVVCIMVSLDIYIVDIIPLNLLSDRINFIDYVKLKKSIVNPLTKNLTRELMYNSLRGMCLKPLKDKGE
jgi:hypothetical protein